jgi:coenzyme F420-0:L-glutamate ligase/coenzyme F420-1:gamma-L-glutamate ligase
MSPCDLRKGIAGHSTGRTGDDLAELTLAALSRSDTRLQTGDVLIFAQKVVSKVEGRAVNLDGMAPTERAL